MLHEHQSFSTEFRSCFIRDINEYANTIEPLVFKLDKRIYGIQKAISRKWEQTFQTNFLFYLRTRRIPAIAVRSCLSYAF